MDKIYKLVYTWKYTPKDLFQGNHNLKFDQYNVIIGEGEITAEVYDATASEHHSIILDHMEHYFKAASILSGLGYKIDKTHNTKAFDENGERLPVAFAPSYTSRLEYFSPQVLSIIKDEEKQQIIEEEKILGEFFANYYHAENPGSVLKIRMKKLKIWQ